ncbi:hypothetical protein LCGC14_1942150 [marine sediment metagenome]|uniref:Uncharacterized protein n=1 Tax=marine sediment metagenome TaxID=412755 RepID=A0A0F9G8H1_9ZZZZ
MTNTRWIFWSIMLVVMIGLATGGFGIVYRTQVNHSNSHSTVRVTPMDTVFVSYLAYDKIDTIVAAVIHITTAGASSSFDADPLYKIICHRPAGKYYYPIQSVHVALKDH